MAIGNTWDEWGDPCFDQNEEKYTLCEVAVSNGVRETVQNLHAELIQSRTWRSSADTAYGVYHFGDGVYVSYPEMTLLRMKSSAFEPNSY